MATPLIFSPSKNKKSIESPSKIVSITLPVISTVIKNIKNSPPILVNDTAVNTVFTTEQKAISSLTKIDIERVSPIKSNAKKGLTKSPYSVKELKEIAKDLQLNMKGKNKKAEFVEAIIERYDELKK